ncbi:MAG: hypothetical protein WBN42_07320 [Ignavibacteriaceae bacterium]
MKALLFLLPVLVIYTTYSQNESNGILKLVDTDTITVNPELPQYILQVYETDDDEWTSVVKIYVIGYTTSVQTIYLNYGRLNTYDEMKDINFDGYNDLEVIDYWGNSQNTFSSFWLFNTNSKLFEESKEFSGFGDITIDKENQTINSWGASIGWNMAASSSTYKVVDNHLVIIEDEYSCKFDSYKKVLKGDSFVTVSRTSAESIEIPSKKEGDYGPDVLWIVTEEEMIYGILRSIRKTWQWEYEGERIKELYEKGILRYSEFGPTYRLEREIIYDYSMDEDNDLFVEESVTEVVDGELVTEHKPKTQLK